MSVAFLNNRPGFLICSNPPLFNNRFLEPGEIILLAANSCTGGGEIEISMEYMDPVFGPGPDPGIISISLDYMDPVFGPGPDPLN